MFDESINQSSELFTDSAPVAVQNYYEPNQSKSFQSIIAFNILMLCFVSLDIEYG